MRAEILLVASAVNVLWGLVGMTGTYHRRNAWFYLWAFDCLIGLLGILIAIAYLRR